MPCWSFNSLQTGKGIARSVFQSQRPSDSVCFNSLQTGKGIARGVGSEYLHYLFPEVSIPFKRERGSQERPYFKPSGAVAPKPQNHTRTARGFFHFKIYPKNPTNPRVHWTLRDFFINLAQKSGDTYVLGQFLLRTHPIDASRLCLSAKVYPKSGKMSKWRSIFYFGNFLAKPGSVRNADRKCKAFSLRSKILPRMGKIWVSTPQNRIYRSCGIECIRLA